MVSIGSKFFQSFRNLKSDAVPRPPRPENVNPTNPPTPPSDNSDDTSSVHEEILIEPVSDSDEDSLKKEKPKKPSFFPNKKKNKGKKYKEEKKKHDYTENEATTPVNTQATGNVINFVNCKDVHWGHMITYNLGGGPNVQTQRDDSNKDIKKSKSVIALLESTIEPEHDYIDYVAKNLGKNWHSFFKSLGYSKGRIETVEMNEDRNGVEEARYKLLLDWIRNDDEPTLGHLSTLLWQEGEREVVKGLAAIYKKNHM